MQSLRWIKKKLVFARRRHGTVYLYEVLILLQLLALHVVLSRKGLSELAVIHHSVRTAGQTLLPFFLAGVAVHLVVAAWRGRARAYLRRVRSWPWLFMSARLLLFGTLTVHVYAWLKSMLPLLHPRLFDDVLWNLDRLLFFGLQPNVFSLYVFNHPLALRAIDLSYGAVFSATLFGSFALFFGMCSDRLRLAFATGYSTLWLAGSWLYLAVPSLGPCYVYPDVWKPFVPQMPSTVLSQQALWENYQMVFAIPQGVISPEFNLLEGVAAFPSLHVGLQLFVVLWAVRVWRFWRVLMYLSFAVIFVGSVVTGWHYLLDSLAGALLGWGAFRLSVGLYDLGRFTRTLRAVRS